MRHTGRFRATFVALTLAAAPNVAQTQADSVRAHYTKRETYITMRDGVRLFTSIYVPRDTSRSHPFMMMRTPYSIAPYGDSAYRASLGPTPAFARDGYIFVYQDVRGRYMSEGVYQYMTPHIEQKKSPRDVDESSDTYDTIEWLLKNVGPNNGRVGTWGISAPGFFAAAGMIDAHPALKAASPQAPLIDWFMGDDRHHNGALMLAQTFNFLSGFDRPRNGPTTNYGPRKPFPTPDGYQYFLDMGAVANSNPKYFQNTATFWNQILEHDTYDEFWQKRSLQNHLKQIKPAVLMVGGWYDAEDPLGPLEAFRAMNRLSASTNASLVVGPWHHGGWANVSGDGFGPIRWGVKTGPFYRDSIERPFFACHLKDQCGVPLPKAVVFETGENRWRTFDAWPPKQASARTIYLNQSGALTWDPPASATGLEQWTSDPKKPVPYTQATSFGYYLTYPIEDQRFAARRADVVVFETKPLEQPLTIAGPIKVSLRVSTSGTDADFIVKLIDVYPDDMPDSMAVVPGTKLGGYQQLLRGDVMRAKFRKSFSKPEPMVPNQPTTVELTLQDIFHTLKPGHRLMVQVQSTWFPLVDRNPQTFVQINKATDADFRSATQRVYFSKTNPSSLRLMVLPERVAQ